MKNAIGHHVKKILNDIKMTSPKTYEQLNLPLTDVHKKSILKVVRNLADDRLQTIGKEIARIAKGSESPRKLKRFSEEALKRQLTQSFHQNKAKLADLRNELIPAPLRSMVDKSTEMTFDADSMRLFRLSKNSWDVDVDKEKPDKSRMLIDTSFSSADVDGGSADNAAAGAELTNEDVSDLTEKAGQGLGVLAGLLEQCRVALDQIDFVGEAFDKDMKIPYWAKSMVGGLDFVAELSDCLLRDGLDNDETTQTNTVKLAMCPMKYASAATDFLESVDNVMGINDANGGLSANSLFGSDDTTPQPAGVQYQQAPQGYHIPQQQQPAYVPQGASNVYR
jgi:hypothetical protein